MLLSTSLCAILIQNVRCSSFTHQIKGNFSTIYIYIYLIFPSPSAMIFPPSLLEHCPGRWYTFCFISRLLNAFNLLFLWMTYVSANLFKKIGLMLHLMIFTTGSYNKLIFQYLKIKYCKYYYYWGEPERAPHWAVVCEHYICCM